MSATIDEALDILRHTGPEYSGGLSNHGPMAAEALITIGRADAVISWVESYKRKLLPHPQARNPVSRENWHEALGDINRLGDWIAFFDRELAEAPWPVVLDDWVERMAPGLVGAATYGVGAKILLDLGVLELRLLTNNPQKVLGLERHGLRVVERIPIIIPPTAESLFYLQTKHSMSSRSAGA